MDFKQIHSKANIAWFSTLCFYTKTDKEDYHRIFFLLHEVIHSRP